MVGFFGFFVGGGVGGWGGGGCTTLILGFICGYTVQYSRFPRFRTIFSGILFGGGGRQKRGGSSVIFEEDFCMGRIFDVFDQTSVFSGSTACFVVFWGVGRDDF